MLRNIITVNHAINERGMMQATIMQLARGYAGLPFAELTTAEALKQACLYNNRRGDSPATLVSETHDNEAGYSVYVVDLP